MKFSTIFFFIAALLLSFNSSSQINNWKIYPSLGVDVGGAIPIPLSDKPGGVNGTPKLSPSLGIGFNYTHNKWGLAIEASYHTLAFSANGPVASQPFYFDNRTDLLYFSGNTETDVELHFFELVVLANYKIGKRWVIQLGPYISNILEGSFNTAGKNGVLSPDKSITDNARLPGVANITYNFDYALESLDYGFTIGYEYLILERLSVWSKFYLGANSIFKDNFNNIDYELYQIRLNVGLSYALFGNNKP